MRDLLVITPSRGRPKRLKAMLHETLAHATGETDVAVALDGDDPAGEEYAELARMLSEDLGLRDRVLWHSGPRNDLTGWTNCLALRYADEYLYLASLGDDHLPHTLGWDRKLTEAGAIAYGNDLHQGENLPTAVVIRSDIVVALGWFCLPAVRHYYCDNVWKDLGEGAGCLAYCEDVFIEHEHPAWGTAPSDPTYIEAFDRQWSADGAAYDAWCRYQRVADVATVKACLA